MVDADGVSVAQTFDDLGRIVSREYPSTGIEQFLYTTNGLVAHTNQLGKTTRYFYDALGRKLYETNANTARLQFAYNASDDLLSLTDGRGQKSQWSYDQYGQMTNKIDATNTVIVAYSYDSSSRLTNRWTVAKGDTAYSYDAVGNLTNVHYPTSADISLVYDGANRLTKMVDGVGTTVYAYTSFGNVQSEDGPWDNDRVTYSYTNQLRSSLSLVRQSQSPWRLDYGYDSAKRLTTISAPEGSYAYSYVGAGSLVQQLTLANTSFITNRYDASGRMSSTELRTSDGTTLNRHAYGYDLVDTVTSVTNTAGNYLSYTYDDLNQLKTASGFESNGISRVHEKLGYGYDAGQNLQYRTNNALVQTFNVVFPRAGLWRMRIFTGFQARRSMRIRE